MQTYLNGNNCHRQNDFDKNSAIESECRKERRQSHFRNSENRKFRQQIFPPTILICRTNKQIVFYI